MYVHTHVDVRTCVVITSLPATSSAYCCARSNIATVQTVLSTVRQQQQAAYYAHVANPQYSVVFDVAIAALAYAHTCCIV